MYSNSNFDLHICFSYLLFIFRFPPLWFDIFVLLFILSILLGPGFKVFALFSGLRTFLAFLAFRAIRTFLPLLNFSLLSVILFSHSSF